MLHRVESTYGRLVPKPQAENLEEDELFDENVPIQDQIENLRTKISLKEKYNRVLTENFEESQQGASSILKDLYNETRELRAQLVDALGAEKRVVENALRTQQVFKLAMSGRVAGRAIPWLDDKLFDRTKKLNDLLDNLNIKRKRLEDAERMVIMIEKWPRPGTLPWEITALDEFERLDNIIENIKIKDETSMILHMKYYNIKFILREEQGKYQPIIRSLENQWRQHRAEFRSLQQMLEEAVYFRDESSKNLILTEKEASENRKQRRKQMAKMKKAVDQVLSDNQRRGPNVKATTFNYAKYEEQVETSHILDELKVKKEIVDQYRDRARRLVDVMRVSDLTLIPTRSKTVRALGKRLRAELDAKEEFRDLLLKQRNQLMLILCHFRYTGQQNETEYFHRLKDYHDALHLIENDSGEAKKRLQRFGDIFVDVRLSVLSTYGRLDPKRRHSTLLAGDLKSHMKHVYSKIKKLVKQVDVYIALFGDKEAERNYEGFVRGPVPQARLNRVGSPVVTDESEEEEMFDIKVPNRQEIKLKGQRFIHQAILSRGLH